MYEITIFLFTIKLVARKKFIEQHTITISYITIKFTAYIFRKCNKNIKSKNTLIHNFVKVEFKDLAAFL